MLVICISTIGETLKFLSKRLTNFDFKSTNIENSCTSQHSWSIIYKYLYRSIYIFPPFRKLHHFQLSTPQYSHFTSTIINSLSISLSPSKNRTTTSERFIQKDINVFTSFRSKKMWMQWVFVLLKRKIMQNVVDSLIYKFVNLPSISLSPISDKTL